MVMKDVAQVLPVLLTIALCQTGSSPASMPQQTLAANRLQNRQLAHAIMT